VGDRTIFGDDPAQPYIMQFRFSAFLIFTFLQYNETMTTTVIPAKAGI
jgi:hypothetical protein